MKDSHSLGELTPEEFTLKAIERLRTPPYKGIHSVYSGFNEAFREYFPLLDPVEVTNQLAKEGKIVIRLVKGGAILYKAGEAPFVQGRDALRKILEEGDTAPSMPANPQDNVRTEDSNSLGNCHEKLG
jgi:hypothetical protein